MKEHDIKELFSDEKIGKNSKGSAKSCVMGE